MSARPGKTGSIVGRLNARLFLRLLGTFLLLDLLLAGLAGLGLFWHAEHRCADVAALVEERGVPTREALAWMAAGDYTIVPLERAPEGRLLPGWLPLPEETADGLRRWEAPACYTVELPNGGEPYAVALDLTGALRLLTAGGGPGGGGPPG